MPMPNRDVTCVVESARKADAQAIAVAHGDGPNTFSVPLIQDTPENASVDNPALATFWGMTGQMGGGEVAAFEQSVDPMINVTDNEEGVSFGDIISSRSPSLRIIQEPL